VLPLLGHGQGVAAHATAFGCLVLCETHVGTHPPPFGHEQGNFSMTYVTAQQTTNMEHFPPETPTLMASLQTVLP